MHPGMKTIDDALELRRRHPRRVRDGRDRDRPPTSDGDWLTIVVVGAGPTGVEIAGQIRELAVRTLRDDFRTFDPASVRVLLLDGGKEPLATFGDDLSGHARSASSNARRRAAGWARASPASTRTASTCRPSDGTERIAAAHRRVGRGRAGVTARRDARRSDRRRGRPGRSHRHAARPHAARAPRGVRGRRHGDAEQPPRRRRGRDARQPARGEHDRAPLARRRRGEAVQVPRPRQRRRDRAVPRDLQRRDACA